MIGAMLAQARRTLDVRRRRRARSAEDVRRLPRRRPDPARARAWTSATPGACTMSATANRAARSRSRPRTRRAPTSTRCSRGSTPTGPTPRCSPRSPRRRSSRWPDAGDGDAGSRRRRVESAASTRARRWTRRPRRRSTTTSSSASGKSEVNLHGSHWRLRRHDGQAAGRAARGPRRDWGSRAGPRSRCSRIIFPALCETMRILIAGQGDRAPGGDCRRSERFFERHVAPWTFDCCDCNRGLSACQLLSARSRIHARIHGART